MVKQADSLIRRLRSILSLSDPKEQQSTIQEATSLQKNLESFSQDAKSKSRESGDAWHMLANKANSKIGSLISALNDPAVKSIADGTSSLSFVEAVPSTASTRSTPSRGRSRSPKAAAAAAANTGTMMDLFADLGQDEPVAPAAAATRRSLSPGKKLGDIQGYGSFIIITFTSPNAQENLSTLCDTIIDDKWHRSLKTLLKAREDDKSKIKERLIEEHTYFGTAEPGKDDKEKAIKEVETAEEVVNSIKKGSVKLPIQMIKYKKQKNFSSLSGRHSLDQSGNIH